MSPQTHSAASSAVGLPQLPTELLRLVWDLLQVPVAYGEREPQPTAVARARDQHALRSACKQLRDVTTPFLSALPIVSYSGAAAVPPWGEALQCALRQLAAFPSAAALTAMRWTYREHNPARNFCAELPRLLPDFFDHARERLTGLRRVTLFGHLALGYGEVSALVDVCPHLHSLTLSAPVFGSALTSGSLARLAGLRSLELRNIGSGLKSQPAQCARMHQPLSLLSALTELKATSASASCSDILPHLHGLTSLRQLEMCGTYVRSDDARGTAVFSHLSQLGQLTSLHMTSTLFAILTLDSGLALPPQLVHLHLRGCKLPTAAVRLACSLPHLRELSAHQMAPDCDLSGLACSYTKLTLESGGSPLQLTRLPLRGVKQFELNGAYWKLSSATDSDHPTPATLHCACQVLATAASPNNANSDLRLSLYCTAVLPSSLACSFLAALAPLEDSARGIDLNLDNQWDLSSEHAFQLAAHLPSLKTLAVARACQSEFAGFVAAVGIKLTRLQSLKRNQ